MLGSLDSTQHWNWASCGKHPVAKDYFNLGQPFPLMSSFSDWIEKGYETFSSTAKKEQRYSSWRFWARDFTKELLVCGLVRESSDSLGRPYPLLIMGTGPLKGWQLYWDFLPFACENTWNHLEYVSAQMFKNLKDLEAGIQLIKPPSPEWSAFIDRRKKFIDFDKNSENKSLPLKLQELERQASILSEKKEGFISLELSPLYDQVVLISLWHFLFKKHSKEMPISIFIGGTLEEAFLSFFKRPLLKSDFVQLWSIFT